MAKLHESDASDPGLRRVLAYSGRKLASLDPWRIPPGSGDNQALGKSTAYGNQRTTEMKHLKALFLAITLLALPAIANGPILFNTSGTPGVAISASGNYCAIGSGANASDGIINVSYIITGGASVTGTVTFQELGPDGTWRSLVSPAPITLSAITFQGTITGPFHGIRLAVTSLVNTITFAELKGY